MRDACSHILPLTISRVMPRPDGVSGEAIQERATKPIHGRRRERGTLFQPRFFDRALRTLREYHRKVEDIPFNPVKARWVSRPEEELQTNPSADRYVSTFPNPQPRVPSPGPYALSGLSVDPITIPADPRTQIWGNAEIAKCQIQEPQTNPSADGYVCATRSSVIDFFLTEAEDGAKPKPKGERR
jgi:hypothetical protein